MIARSFEGKSVCTVGGSFLRFKFGVERALRGVEIFAIAVGIDERISCASAPIELFLHVELFRVWCEEDIAG